ncbi:hypothetical protein CB1_000305011 [Camelus ferus]|nr:hypothetical protein CB1_000305011 [Camelus ferus]
MRRRRLEASAQSPMEISPITMVEEETFFRGHGKLPDCPGSESPASVPSQGTLTEEPDRDPEKWHVSFRTFSGSEESDPIQDLRRLRELCRLWLRPDLHTKEQIMDKLVLEQFMTCMPLGCQVLVRESGVESCRDLEDLLRENRKPKKWTVVHIRGKNFLVRDPEVQRAEAGVSDTDDERKLFREPQSPMNGVRPENGQQVSRERQERPGVKALSTGRWLLTLVGPCQEEKALQPETTPESADLEGLTPKRNVEEDMLEDRKEAGALQAQPELQEGPDSGTAQGGKDAQEGMDLQRVHTGEKPSLRTCESTSESTRARSRTAVTSAPRGPRPFCSKKEILDDWSPTRSKRWLQVKDNVSFCRGTEFGGQPTVTPLVKQLPASDLVFGFLLMASSPWSPGPTILHHTCILDHRADSSSGWAAVRNRRYDEQAVNRWKTALAPRTLQGKDLSIIDVQDLEEHPTHSWAAWLLFEGKLCSLNYWCLLFC